jgi:signal transduction histidine kinase
MRKTTYSAKGNLKGLLFILGIILVIGGIWYTDNLVQQLKEKSTEYLRFKIKVLEESINNPNADMDFSFLFYKVIKEADYPIIYTDTSLAPQSWKNINKSIDQKNMNELSQEESQVIKRILGEISQENEPISIKAQDRILGYYFYGYSPVIQRLNDLPYIAVFAALAFILIGYVGFSYIKRSEQSYIWVGMAKETAHQLGTPLSAISGWLELLQLDEEMRDTAVKEMKNDVKRLNKVATRFSKIGSVPALKRMEVAPLLENVVRYFSKRLPNMQSKINIGINGSKNIKARINEDLLEWVFENLIKNAIDAIESKEGEIKIHIISRPEKKQFYIDISDSGKGIPQGKRKAIFKPGYSSKKRGWGLGLSLAKRIIEEYHNGKLFLKDSRAGEETTFRIVLQIAENES